MKKKNPSWKGVITYFVYLKVLWQTLVTVNNDGYFTSIRKEKKKHECNLVRKYWSKIQWKAKRIVYEIMIKGFSENATKPKSIDYQNIDK